MSFAAILEQELRESKLMVSATAQEKLARYASEIEHWNKAVNLTALHGAALVHRLIVEPVWVGQQLGMSGVLADVGSGNGSPGIPLCVTGNFRSASLIEPRMKRTVFLRHIIAKLGLKDVSVLRNRVEEVPVPADPALRADWIVLQAIDPKGVVLQALHRIGSETTRVVWITSVEIPPVPDAEKLEIPDSKTRIWIFRLDQI